MVSIDPAVYRDRLPRQLSGGQRQRVGLARAMAARPHIMLMDEPFGSLDPLTRDTLQREYRRIHQQLGLTTVMVTHDMTEALLMADRIAVMSRRRHCPSRRATPPAHRARRRLCATTHGDPQAAGRSARSPACHAQRRTRLMWNDLPGRIGQIATSLPANLASHLMITMIALAAGLAVSLPLGIVIARRRGCAIPC